ERLRTRHLVDQVTVDIQERLSRRQLRDGVRVPDLFVKCLAHTGSILPLPLIVPALPRYHFHRHHLWKSSNSATSSRRPAACTSAVRRRSCTSPSPRSPCRSPAWSG